jgi:hypothetical protein
VSLPIVLRTVCGCERILKIPFQRYPPEFAVPYVRRNNYWMAPKDGESCMTTMANRRVFENTGRTGTYGYQLYLEVLPKERLDGV